MFIRCSWLFAVLTFSWLARASSYTDLPNNLLLDELTKTCPSDGIPVCGVRHKQFVLFSNGCLLDEMNKDVLLDKTSFKKIPLKYCMYGCQFSCANIYKPICARNMKTLKKELFINQCELTKYACKTNKEFTKINVSECQPPTNLENYNRILEKRSQASEKNRRPIPCTNVFKPVCGSYMGVKSSFRNECLLNAENVKFNRDWRIVKYGMCAEDLSKDHHHKEKPTKPHSVKKRSYQDHFFSRFQNEHDYNTNNFMDYKSPPNVSPNDLYVFMPPAFQAQFLNHGNPGYQQPIPVNKAYDEIINKIVTFPSAHIPATEDEETAKIEEPIFDKSIIRPLPFAANRMNFNYIPNPNVAYDINQQSLPEAINTFMDGNNKEFYHEFENNDHNVDDDHNEEMTTTSSTSTSVDKSQDNEFIPTTTITTQDNVFIPTTTIRPKLGNRIKQLKREKALEQDKECKFGSTPICGTLADGTARTFDTICEMMASNVYLKNTWTKLHDGVCDDCKYNCSREYYPVCVSRNGVNYTMVNDCYYNMGICMDKKSKWQKLSNGECERYTRIADKYANLKPGFSFTSKYFVSETTPLPSTDGKPIAITNKPLERKYRKSKKRRPNPKRAISRRMSSQRCCPRSHYTNEFIRDDIKCKCWSDTTQAPLTRLSLYGPQTESYIMRLVKDRVERVLMN